MVPPTRNPRRWGLAPRGSTSEGPALCRPELLRAECMQGVGAAGCACSKSAMVKTDLLIPVVVSQGFVSFNGVGHLDGSAFVSSIMLVRLFVWMRWVGLSRVWRRSLFDAPSAMAMTVKAASIAPAAPRRWPVAPSNEDAAALGSGAAGRWGGWCKGWNTPLVEDTRSGWPRAGRPAVSL